MSVGAIPFSEIACYCGSKGWPVTAAFVRQVMVIDAEYISHAMKRARPAQGTHGANA